MSRKILVVDDDETICFTLRSIFKSQGYEVQEARSGEQALEFFKGKKGKTYRPEVALVDVRLPDMDGLQVMESIKDFSPETCVLIITGYGTVKHSVDAMQRGASDYVLKPFNVDEITLRVNRALKSRKLSEQAEFLGRQSGGGDWDSKYSVGPNARMQKLYQTINRVAKSGTTTVFIHGETGTGKEVIARRVHLLSDRANKPFVAINATALTPELLESELFGHEEGSFTGATRAKKGLFEVADGGTLFLDEIGDMDLLMQAKVLRAIQERAIRRVGGTEDIPVDLRFITATNKDLEKAVAAGEFREDLYYRLMVVPVELPPLRERKDDIESLVRHFVKMFNTQFGGKIADIEPAAFEALRDYAWPGNVRELRNLLERTILLECDGPVLKLEHLQAADKRLSSGPRPPLNLGNGEKDELIGQRVSLEVVEREHIEKVLNSTDGNKNKAAQILGIDRTTLYNKLKKYQMT